MSFMNELGATYSFSGSFYGFREHRAVDRVNRTARRALRNTPLLGGVQRHLLN
jgi:hypothetical protein